MARKTTGHLFKRGSTYYLRYRLDGQEHTVSTRETSKDKAEAFRQRTLGPLALHDTAAQIRALQHHVEQTEAEILTARERVALVDAWRLADYTTTRHGSTERPLAAATARDYQMQWQVWQQWATGKVHYVDEVTAADAQAFRRHLLSERGISANRTNKIVQLLKIVWERLQTPTNPWAGVKPRAHVVMGHKPLTEQQLRDICAAATGEMRTLIAIGIYTGLRLGKALSLRWLA